jgi:hypothetical protein
MGLIAAFRPDGSRCESVPARHPRAWLHPQNLLRAHHTLNHFSAASSLAEAQQSRSSHTRMRHAAPQSTRITLTQLKSNGASLHCRKNRAPQKAPPTGDNLDFYSITITMQCE